MLCFFLVILLLLFVVRFLGGGGDIEFYGWSFYTYLSLQ